MTLLDHFRGPLQPFWTSFHAGWMTELAADVTRMLPRDFVALPSNRFGIEIDMAALERLRDDPADDGWQSPWSPPSPTASVPFAPVIDELEVLIHEHYPGEYRLVAAVEFVSPANKDRPESRRAFVSKCHGYLQKGVGLLLVDVVTTRHANLHDELMAALGRPEQQFDAGLYATAYRATGADGDGTLDIWRDELAVGRPLPTLPLWLYGGLCIPARLGDTYAETARRQRTAEWAESLRPRPAASATPG